LALPSGVRGTMTCCDDFQVRIRRPAEAVGLTGGMSNGNFRVLRSTERAGQKLPLATGSFDATRPTYAF